MSATILQFPVARTKGFIEADNAVKAFRRAYPDTAAEARKVRHAQQGAQIDAFAERMEALEDLFRGCE